MDEEIALQYILAHSKRDNAYTDCLKKLLLSLY